MTDSEREEFTSLNEIIRNIKLDMKDLPNYPGSWEQKLLIRYWQLARLKVDEEMNRT